MAAVNTSVYMGNLTGLPASPGCLGCEVVRVTTDGAGAGTTAITLPTSSSIKTIYSVLANGPCNLAAGTTFPIAASTGVTLNFIAADNATSGKTIDVLVFGLGV
jgi:hypothetical protein